MSVSTGYEMLRNEQDYLAHYAELVRQRTAHPSDASRRPPSTSRLVALALRLVRKQPV